MDAHREAFFVNFAQIRPPQARLPLSAELIGDHSDFIKFHLTFELLADGERPHYVSKQMGHANLYVTLSRYAKFIPSEDDGQILSKVTEK